MNILGRVGRMAALMMAAAVSAVDRELAPAADAMRRAADTAEPKDNPQVRVVVTEACIYDLDSARGKDRMPFHKRLDWFRSRVVTFVAPDDNGKPITCKVDPRTVRVDGTRVYAMTHLHLMPDHVLKRADHPPQAASAAVIPATPAE